MIGCKIERRLAYPIGFLFELVTDIEAYPLYMPGWRAVRVLTRTPGRAVVEQIVSLGGVRVRFRSTADADPPHRLEIRSNDPPFRYYRVVWRFTPDGPAETIVQAGFEVAFRSRTLERIAAPVMPIMLERVITAFERRAAQRFRVAPHHPPADRPGEPCSGLARKEIAEGEEQSGREMDQDGQRIHREQCEGQPATVLGRVLPARDPLPATALGDEENRKRQ